MPEEPTHFELAERLAFLERHVQQQDMEIYAQSEQIRRLQAAVAQLRTQSRTDKHGVSDQDESPFPADERPPHY